MVGKIKKQIKSNKLFVKFYEIKYELLLNAIAMIIGIFIGLLAGFQLENYRQIKSANTSTKMKLHSMYLETQYNIVESKKALDAYYNPDSINVHITRLDEQSVRATIKDGNIYNILPHYKVSLIKTYLDALLLVNKENEKYINYVSAMNFKQTPNAIIIRKSIKNNIISFMAACIETQAQLKEYFDETLYDKEKIKEIESRITNNKKAIEDGNFKLEKDVLKDIEKSM